LRDHDTSGKSGDGPSGLLKEILGVDTTTMEIDDDLEIVQPCTLKSTSSAIDVEDLTFGVHCDNTSTSSLTLPTAFPAAAGGGGDIDNTADVGDGIGYDNSLKFNEDMKLIDLLDESIVSELPSMDEGKKNAESKDDGTDDVYNISTPQKLCKGECADAINLMDDSDDDDMNHMNAYNIPTPARRDKEQCDLSVIDLVGEDDCQQIVCRSEKEVIDLTDIGDYEQPGI
jgi:hypothetical protein